MIDRTVKHERRDAQRSERRPVHGGAGMSTPDGSRPDARCPACRGTGRVWDRWIGGWNNCGCAAASPAAMIQKVRAHVPTIGVER